MKRVLRFIKRHGLVSMVLAPVMLFMIGWPFMIIGEFSHGKYILLYEAGSLMVGMVYYIMLLLYPFLLTGCNLYFIVKQRPEGFKKTVSILSEIATIVLGALYSLLYIEFVSDVLFMDWQEVLRNSEVHTPIATWAFPSILFFTGVGILGYIVLRAAPLKVMPPLVAVLSISAMYIGCLMCVLWTVQTFSGNVFMYLFPLNCILLAAKVIRSLLWQWQELHPGEETAGICGKMGNLKRLLRDSRCWPWLALILMLPLLGILIMILTLFGQEPDNIIRAWTETSEWNLSRRVSPPNVRYDEHYLCTVAAGGHPKLVHPLRMGVRHGHRIVVNRQLCVANAFEQILMERLPGVHRMVRLVYDRYGYPLARHIRTPLASDIVYIVMKPLEWIFLAVIYLCDIHPENRIAMQYITPAPQSFS